jgi:uncharacterized membrane protein
MDVTSVGLVFLAAAIHPLRELLLKGNTNARSGYFSINLVWLFISALHVFFSGADLTTAAVVWPLIVISGTGLLAYHFGILTAMRTGDLSVYYPIIRSSPIFIVVAGWVVLGESYSFVTLIGVALVTLGAWLLKYKRGSKLLNAPAALVASLVAMSGMGMLSLADAEAMRHLTVPVLVFWEYVFVVSGFLLILLVQRPAGEPLVNLLFGGFIQAPWNVLIAACTSYFSYFLILHVYGLGGDVVAVNCLRQISIPLSVVLGGLVLRELHMTSRFAWSLILVAGIIIIIISK